MLSINRPERYGQDLPARLDLDPLRKYFFCFGGETA